MGAMRSVGGRTGHNPVLDGIRGLAIGLVMLHHFVVLEPKSGVGGWMFYLSGLGVNGVSLFFVLSGFLITGILLDSKASPGYYRNFYARRTLRIFPLYYLVVFIALVVIPTVGPMLAAHAKSPAVADLIRSKVAGFGSVEGDGPYFWLYLSNIPIAVRGSWMHNILGVSWSLAIEEQFYLVWPMVVALCSRRALVRVCLGLIAGAFLLRCGLTVVQHSVAGPLPFANPIGIYVTTFCRVDTLAAGALLSVWFRSREDSGRGVAFARASALVLTPVLLLLAVLDRALGLSADGFGAGFGMLFQTVGNSLAAWLFASVILLAVHAADGGLWRRAWVSRPMLTLGKYSYAIYLVHLPVRAAVRDLLFGPAGSGARFKFPVIAGSELAGQLIYMAIAGLASVAVAIASWHLFEKHFIRFKALFPAGGGPPRGPRTPEAQPGPAIEPLFPGVEVRLPAREPAGYAPPCPPPPSSNSPSPGETWTRSGT